MFNTIIYDIVYTAGLFDGEGNISIHKATKKKYTEYYLAIAIVNTHLPTMEYLKERFGGEYYPITLGKRGRKQCWRWELHYGKAAEFIEILYPFLVIKKADADIAIKFRQTINTIKRSRVSQDTMKLRESYYQEIKKR